MKLMIKDLTKKYGDFVALHPTSIDVRQGEFLTLLGPSGSGKTTLLTLIAGLATPDGGEVFINGNQATQAPSYQRDLGMIFQSYALFPHMSVYENVAFPLRMRRVPEKEIAAKVANILEIISLPNVASRLPKELSGGQQQRVALARATVYEPSIVLMDEPLGALDKNLREQMQLEIKRLHKILGTTIIYVTHDQDEALSMSDRICLMNGGKIEQLATPGEIYNTPATVFAANFIGQSNIFLGSQIQNHAHPADDSTTRIMVRPEYVHIGSGDLKAGHCAVPATFFDIVNLGATSRYYFKTSTDDLVTCLVLNSQPIDPLSPGQAVSLRWPQQHSVTVRAGS